MTRRDVLRSAAVLLHASWAGLLSWAGFVFLRGPRSLNQEKEVGEWNRVVRLSDLPPGQPVLCEVRATRSDGFWAATSKRIGAVWVKRSDAVLDEGTPETGSREEAASDAASGVRAWQSICPHLGCGIEFMAATGGFSCPCHASAFSADGKRIFGPSPRDLDAIACRISAEGDRERWVEVQYREFETGLTEKVARGSA